MKKIIDKVKPKPKTTKPKVVKPKQEDEFDRLLNLIIDAMKTKRTAGVLVALQRCLKGIENEDK
jgi:hypothetical protein